MRVVEFLRERESEREKKHEGKKGAFKAL